MKADGIDTLMQENGQVSEPETRGNPELQQLEMQKLEEQIDASSIGMVKDAQRKLTKKEKAAAEEAAALAQEETLSSHERVMSPAWRRLYAAVRKYQSK
ncbi:hypothetical protein D3C73_738940 [compost metagenome]